VPWKGDLDGATVQQPGIIGWFQCPCHLSTFSRAGILVSGPSSRPMSTMPIRVNPDGSILVDTSKITAGLAENPKRAVAYSG
jgi:Rieske Fe-S protein